MYPKVARFNIDQSVQLISDQFEIIVNSAQPFIDRDSISLVDLSTGLLDAGGDPALIRHITAGKIDEIELRCEPPVNTCLIRGRDASAAAIDTSVYVTYMTGGRDRRLDLPEPPELPVGLAPIPGVTEPLVLPGTWTASAICADLASRVGLSIVYGVRDYVLREDVTVSGPVIQAIQSLIAPFAQFEPSKPDIWSDGTTLVIKPRDNSGPVDPINVFDIKDARISSQMIRSRILDFIRTVRLTGMSKTSPCLSGLLEYNVVTTDEIIDNVTGNVTTRIVETRTLRIPDDAELRSVKETWIGDSVGGSMAFPNLKSETFFNQDLLFFDANCNILGNPRLNGSVTIESTMEEGEIKRKTIKYSYDGDGFMRAEEMTEEDKNADTKNWEPFKREIKTYRRPSVKMVQTTTETFGPDTDGSWTPSQDTRRSTGSGLPPGGPGRAPQSNAVSSPPIGVAAIISGAPGAKDISYSNPNLTEADLQVIMGQAVAASGAVEMEVNFTAVGVPWLRRGQRMALTGLSADDGTPIPLQTMFVTEVRTEFDEASATSLSSVKAAWWE